RALLGDSGQLAMAGNNQRFVGKSEDVAVKRTHDSVEVAAGQVCAADAAGEERVAGDKLLFGREVDADASLRVTGRGHHRRLQFAEGDQAAVVEAGIDADRAGCLRPYPGRLDIEHL